MACETILHCTNYICSQTNWVSVTVQAATSRSSIRTGHFRPSFHQWACWLPIHEAFANTQTTTCIFAGDGEIAPDNNNCTVVIYHQSALPWLCLACPASKLRRSYLLSPTGYARVRRVPITLKCCRLLSSVGDDSGSHALVNSETSDMFVIYPAGGFLQLDLWITYCGFSGSRRRYAIISCHHWQSSAVIGRCMTAWSIRYDRFGGGTLNKLLAWPVCVLLSGGCGETISHALTFILTLSDEIKSLTARCLPDPVGMLASCSRISNEEIDLCMFETLIRLKTMCSPSICMCLCLFTV